MRQTIAIRSLFLAFLVSAPLPASQDGGESSRVRTADGRIRLAIQYGLDRSASRIGMRTRQQALVYETAEAIRAAEVVRFELKTSVSSRGKM
jgi:hypothetical protein